MSGRFKIKDVKFAAKVLADGRTVGHPAQTIEGVGEEKYASRYCLPFTMDVGNAQHVARFYEFLKERKEGDDPVDVYLINTTGRVGTEYEWIEEKLGDETIRKPKPKLREVDGRIRPVGGTGPSIEETELFLFQAARGAVEYEPHPIWGEKVLVPVKVEGIPEERLRQLNPFTYHSMDEMREFLRIKIRISKYYLDIQCPGLPREIYDAMDF